MFSKKVIEFCEKEDYYRDEPVDEKEFSQVAHRLYGIFFMSDLDLEKIVEVTNCIIYARTRKKDE